jgi:hypothetical protein
LPTTPSEEVRDDNRQENGIPLWLREIMGTVMDMGMEAVVVDMDMDMVAVSMNTRKLVEPARSNLS